MNANATGFRGGTVEQFSSPTGGASFTYRSSDPSESAEKAEGIAGSAAVYEWFGGQYGRGAPANGGGGGNAHNAGGGGGANGTNGEVWTGQGIMSGYYSPDPWELDPGYQANGNARTNSAGGGRGGYTYSNSNQDALFVPPGDFRWGGSWRLDVGGLGGRPVFNDPGKRLFLGGGGGAGDSNNGTGGGGGRGGGLVWVVADTVTGSGRITANGERGHDTLEGTLGNDAPGGGGAGGTVVVSARALSGVSIDANGGRGGYQVIHITSSLEAEGPGGGGGGGYIAVSGGTPKSSVAGGVGGVSTSDSMIEFWRNGATDGANGQLDAEVTALPLCLPPDAPVLSAPGAFVSTQRPLIAGTAEAGGTVRVWVDGNAVGTTTANNEGLWTLTPDTALTEGLHRAMATVTDAAGNVSAPSADRSFMVGFWPPPRIKLAIPACLPPSTLSLSKGAITAGIAPPLPSSPPPGPC